MTAISVDGLAPDNSGMADYNLAGFLASAGASNLSTQLFGQFTSESIQKSSSLATHEIQIDLGSLDSITEEKRTIVASVFSCLYPTGIFCYGLTNDITSEGVIDGSACY